MSIHRLPSRRRSGGFSLVEILIAAVVAAVALLSYAATVMTEDRMAKDEISRSATLDVAWRFVERLHADEDWSGLYARLRLRMDQAALRGDEGAPLEDGRFPYRPQAYFGDLLVPPEQESLRVLVDVPSALPADGSSTVPVFREDVAEARFGLPADLNADGAIDANARDGDYAYLPVVITLRWVPRGEAARETRFSTWLRGDR